MKELHLLYNIPDDKIVDVHRGVEKRLISKVNEIVQWINQDQMPRILRQEFEQEQRDKMAEIEKEIQNRLGLLE